MPAYKEKDRNTWTVKFKHRNWSGQIKWVTKRGFATKRDALQYEGDLLARQSGNLDISFADFVDAYREARGARIKESTLSMKDNIIDTKIICAELCSQNCGGCDACDQFARQATEGIAAMNAYTFGTKSRSSKQGKSHTPSGACGILY